MLPVGRPSVSSYNRSYCSLVSLARSLSLSFARLLSSPSSLRSPPLLSFALSRCPSRLVYMPCVHTEFDTQKYMLRLFEGCTKVPVSLFLPLYVCIPLLLLLLLLQSYKRAVACEYWTIGPTVIFVSCLTCTSTLNQTTHTQKIHVKVA